MRKRTTANATSANEIRLDSRSSRPLPPKRSEKPSTSRRLPTTLPVREPRTTSVSPELTAISAMISSGAFPKVALRKPPMPGPVWCAACSVASPISQASGISARAARTKSVMSPTSVNAVESDDERAEGEQRVEDAANHGAATLSSGRVLRAVLFDWGDTLFHFAFDEELLEAGWEAGLATLERDGLPGHDETAAVFRERYLPLLFVPGSRGRGRVPGH